MKRLALGGQHASLARKLTGRSLKLALFAGASAITLASFALAGPEGGTVVDGAAVISKPTTTTTQIDQSTNKAIIDWKSFNVGKDEQAIFNQPNSASVTLNRIFDADPSIIAGLVSANGHLILINANGMVFENGATVNTAGLIATTADISNSDFMAGNYRFETPGSANASIVNNGLITAEEGGVVAFVAPSVRNSGVIQAKLGKVALGAGHTFVLDLYGDNLISFPVSAEIATQLVGQEGTALIEAGGTIEAGSVQLTARAARGLIDNVINVDGEIIASGVKQTGGSTFLTGGTFDPLRHDTHAVARIDDAAGGGGSGALAGYGGRIVIDGGANNVNIAGSLSASGATGGSISVSGNNVTAGGSIAANGATGAGGSVSIDARNFAALTGTISANGAVGGSVNVNASNLLTAGAISADGSSGMGGAITFAARERQIATSATQVSASGAAGGGTISASGGTGLFTSGNYKATSSSGAGGSVAIGGADIKMIDAKVDASGATAGGSIAVGFTGAGDSRLINAEKILVSPTSTFSADATANGDGGSVVFWSNLSTDFMGSMTAKGGALGGDGGFLEVSSKGEIGFWGLGDASAANGASGQLLLDPKNIVVSSTGGVMPSYELIDPGSGSTTFGGNVAALANGNTVVTSTGDDTVASNSGAVFLYNTTTGALVSMITGSRADDAIGSGGITVLSSGNFVFASSNWDNTAAATNAGAVTFGNGTTGVSGVVSAANSLVGAASNMNVGSGGVTALSNGSYVVSSPNWDSANNNVGAVTWGNGTTGIFGTVSAANSLVGSATDDQVGSGGITALSNGNYVVRSLLWNNGATTDAGAVTWGNGLGGTVGAVSAANSLVGSANNDQIGSNGVTALTNGNYVVASSSWNNGATTDAGAVTWGNGLGGTVGTLSAANSLVGTTTNNNVGSGGVVALSNGNFVALSPNWDGANQNVGAVTWGNGLGGTVGGISAANSLVGSNTNDNIGSAGVRALTNGNYVVASPNWNNGAVSDAGAATWGNGLGGTVGTLSSANSLVGTATNNNVGSGGIVALSNGNYAVVSPGWDNGGTNNVGAVTWGNGTTGTSGNVGAGNSTTGSTNDDQVGSGGVFALTNGNYVIASPLWNNGGTGDAGAATWRSGTAASSGTVSAANSLVGTRSNDNIGSGGITALTNGNYVVVSPNWDSGAIFTSNQGAVTWGNGATGTSGNVTNANSLVGASSGDQAGSGGVIALSNGDYVVSTPGWNNGFTSDVGAITLGTGAGGTVGSIATGNSMIGPSSGAQLSAAGVTSTNEILARSTSQGTVLVGLTDPNQLTFARAQGQTLTVNPAFLTRTLNTGTAVTLQASNDLTVSSDIIANNPTGNGGALTLQAGRSVLINADITTDNGNLTIFANDLLASGVINAQRDPGSAVITMGAGADINAGTGAVRLAILSGAGKTNTASGDLTLRNVTAGSILAENLGPSNGNIVLASGQLNASGAGTPLVLAAQGGNFINNAGAAALQAPNGRWIVYSQSPTANTLGGITGSSPYYNTPYNPANPTGLAATGNRFAYTIAPTLTVTPNNASREYGDANPAFTFGVTGLLAGDTLAGAVQGAPNLSSLADANSAAGGSYAINASLGTLASDYNYGFAFGAGQLTITPAQLFYLANSASRIYGDANPALTGTVTGLKNGELIETVATGTATFTSTADATSNVGNYAITGSGLSIINSNYVLAQAAANATALSVTPATLSYVANGASREYGDANPTLTGTVTGFKNSDTLATATTGALTFTSSADVFSNVGSYAVVGSGLSANNGNYVFVQDPTNATALTINPALLTYVADTASRIYGDANPAFSGTVAGFKNGDTQGSATTGAITFTSTADETTNVGTYAINGSGLTANSGNYTFGQAASNATALSITPAQLTFLANAASREYGDPNGVLTGSVLGLKNGDTIDQVASGILTFGGLADEESPVGTYGIVGGGITVTSGNYLPTFLQDPSNATALTVVPAQLYYLAEVVTTVYGEIDLNDIGGELFGLKNSDNPEDVGLGTPTFFSSITTTSGAGVYAVNGTGFVVTNPNYAVTVLQAASNATAFTVNPAQLFYSADSDEREYGEANPLFTGAIDGLVNGDTLESVVSGTLAFTSAATATSNVGLYAIDGSGLTVISPNYQLTILQDAGNATAFEITPATLTYLADAASRVYGDSNPTFTGQLLGLKNGETIEQVSDGDMTFTSPATATSNVGTYGIFGGGLTITSGNYVTVIEQDSQNDDALTITPAQLIYSATPITRVYGQPNGLVTGTILGLKNGETLASVTEGTLLWTPDADETSDVGVYAIEGSGLAVVSENYEQTIEQAIENNAALTITPAQLTYLADPKFRLYGFPNPPLTGQVLGVTNGDDISEITTGTLGFSTTAGPFTLGGLYPITGGGLTVVSNNYIATILQDPSNATALVIQDIPANAGQALGEGGKGDEGAVDEEQNTMTSRENELGIVGVGPVSDDMADGKNDQQGDQLCVLGAREAANAPGCVARQQAQGR